MATVGHTHTLDGVDGCVDVVVAAELERFQEAAAFEVETEDFFAFGRNNYMRKGLQVGKVAAVAGDTSRVVTAHCRVKLEGAVGL